MLNQRTLKTAIRTTGVGLHTGARVELALRPAPVDAGIVFYRVDLPGSPAIPGEAGHVGDTRLSSTLKSGAVSAPWPRTRWHAVQPPLPSKSAPPRAASPTRTDAV